MKNKLEIIQNINSFIAKYQRFFVDFSAIDSVKKAQYLAQLLISCNIGEQNAPVIFLNLQTKIALSNNKDIYNAFVEPLQNKALLDYNRNSNNFNGSFSELIKIFRNKRREKVLYITCNEQAGVEFELVDIRDNQLNDFDAAGFGPCTSLPNEGEFSWHRYDAELPPEDYDFNLKIEFEFEFIRLNFYKTTSDGYEKVPGDTDSVKKVKDTVYQLRINKWLLFESALVEFEAKIKGKIYKSDKIDFRFSDDQKWYLIFDGSRLRFTKDYEVYKKEVVIYQTVDNKDGFAYIYDNNDDYKNKIEIKLPNDEKLPITIFSKDIDKNAAGEEDFLKLINQYVYSEKKEKIKITGYIHFGGEGIVYDCSNPNLVVKVLFDPKRMKSRVAKLRLMANNAAKMNANPRIIWPQEVVLDKENNGEFVGFTMRKLRPAAEFGDLESFMFNLPNYNLSKKEIVDLAIGLCEIVAFVHSKKIVLGDLKFANLILEKNDFDKRDFTKICLVDSDSFQIEKFPCSVATMNYLPPEYEENDIGNFYRRIEGDLFTLNVMLFNIFFQNKFPYACKNGAYPDKIDENDISDNHLLAKVGFFPYSLNADVTRNRVPRNGYCAARWSHLPSYIKDAFISSFNKGEKHFKPKDRLKATEWLELLRRYRKDLDGALVSKDPEYDVAFPKTEINYDDVKLANERKVTRLSLNSLVEAAFQSLSLPLDSSKRDLAKKELAGKGVYEDSDIRIELIVNLGVIYTAKVNKK